MVEPESRWDAPVVYLREYPLVGEFGPRGVPFYLCERCGGRLDLVPGGGDAGAMFVCVYGCGQRYWIDKDGWIARRARSRAMLAVSSAMRGRVAHPSRVPAPVGGAGRERLLALLAGVCALLSAACASGGPQRASAPARAATTPAAVTACERYIVSATVRGLVVDAYVAYSPGGQRWAGYRRALYEMRSLVPWGQESALGRGAVLLERVFSANDDAIRGLLVNDVGMFEEASMRAEQHLVAFEQGLLDAGCVPGAP